MLLVKERYIYDKDTKKITENQAVGEVFCLRPEGHETSADYGTGRLRFIGALMYL